MDKKYCFTREELGEIFSVTPRAITDWGLESVGKRGQAKLYYLPDVIAHRLGREKPQSTTFELTEERSRLTHHQANIAELEERQKRDELFSIPEVLYFCTAAHSVARNKVLGIHSKIASAYPDIDPEVIETIEEVSIEAINGIGVDGIPAPIAGRIREAARRVVEGTTEADGK